MKKLNLSPLVRWFHTHKRDLPWRIPTTPSSNTYAPPRSYAVWISEIMLQQTQVKTVIPYFEKWMQNFPTIPSLAEAPEEAIMKAWEGLGYYSRARMLHQAAKTCVERFEGELPQDPTLLREIKGIGPYTQGAILSFAFNKRAAAVDGNVLRVVSRLIGSKKDISLSSTRKEIEIKVLEVLPDDKPWEAMEALIELGALVCSKKPACDACPLRDQCRAYLLGETESIPVKLKKITSTKLTRHALIITAENHILLKKGEKGKVMEGLWEFPYFENLKPEHHWGVSLANAEYVGKIKHGFTRYQVDLSGWKVQLLTKFAVEDCTWIPQESIKNLPFSSGMKKLLNVAIPN